MHGFDNPVSLPSFRVIFDDITQYCDDADRIFKRKERFDLDRRDFYARSMVLFALCNRLVDLAREVCLYRGYISLDESVKNKVFFKWLNDHAVISWDMRQEMIAMVNFRNRISHHFYEVSRDEIEAVFTNLSVFRDFIGVMEGEIAREDYEKKRVLILAGAILLVLLLVFVWYFS